MRVLKWSRILYVFLFVGSFEVANCHYNLSPFATRTTLLRLRGGSDSQALPQHVAGITPPSIAEPAQKDIQVAGQSTAESVPQASSTLETDKSEPIATAATSPESTKTPSKWANVRQRTIPAVLMLGGLAGWIKLFDDTGMIVLVFLFQALLYSEATTVVNVSDKLKWWWFLYGCLGTSGAALVKKQTWPALASYSMAALGIVALVIQLNAPGNNAASFRAKLGELSAGHFCLLALVYTTSFWISTIQEFGIMWVLYPALLVIVNDTMAYVFGMAFGKHALLPVISPKKTFEGLVGATLSTMAAAVPLATWLVAPSDQPIHALTLATYISLIAPFGGFLASITKRAHGKKDFGSLIPGHGGVVDRLDCQVITAPFVYMYLKHFL